MSQYDKHNPYRQEYAYVPASSGSLPVAALAEEWDRAAFVRRTYAHLAGAVAAFIGIEAVIFTIVPPDALHNLVGTMVSGWNWLFVLGAMMLVSWVAQGWASSSASQGMQYLGLALYVVAEAVIFVPLLYIASRYGGPATIPTAGIITGVVFGGLTGVVFITRADFSGLGKYLWLAGFLALGFIVCSIFFKFQLGMVFNVALIGLACGYVLYYTSNVMHHYRLDQHVAASLALFAAVATLFWYILRIVMELNRR